MIDLNVNNQSLIFFVFTLDGVIIGLLFDFFRIVRKTFKIADVLTYIQDISFWILTGLIFLYSMYKFCDGELRFFMLLGVLLGVLIYIFTLSRLIMKFAVFVINLFK